MHYTTQDPRHVPTHDPRQAPVMPRPSIPKEHNGWFMWLLLVLAGLVVAGVVYSFWRIARVPNPTVDVPGERAPAPAAPAQEAPPAR